MIKVMSFNIRYGLADDGENHWNNRKRLALARIQAFGPDLLGLQECRDDAQADFVRLSLPDYHFLGIHRGGPGDTALEMAPLLFRRSAFELLDTGCFWLSETPEIPGSRSWGSAYPRTVTWARLARLPLGAVLTSVNTHFDYEPTTAIDGNAKVLRHWLDQIRTQTPVIVTGDFNADRESEAYRLLTGEGALIDTFRLWQTRARRDDRHRLDPGLRPFPRSGGADRPFPPRKSLPLGPLPRNRPARLEALTPLNRLIMAFTLNRAYEITFKSSLMIRVRLRWNEPV